MRKEGRGMGERYGIFAAAFVCVMLLAACNDVFKPVKIPAPVDNGYGRISVSIAGESALAQTRTVLPSTAFDKYEYTFTKKGEANGVELEPDSEGFFFLELGAYTVRVKASVGTAEPYTLAATGESPEFIVAPGINDDPVEVLLSGLDTLEQGEFTYTINYQYWAVSDVEISLQKWPSLSDVELDPEDLIDETHLAVNGKTETITLEAGSYLFTVFVSRSDWDGTLVAAGISEAIHIYPSVSTEYTKDFEYEELISFVPKKPAAPTVSPPPGTYNTEELYMVITLSASTENATIYYTFDNSIPSTLSSNQTSSPSIDIYIYEPTTIRAVTVKGGVYSDVITAAYILPPVKPYISPQPGNYPIAQSITLEPGTAGSVIHYTLNGDDPTPGSAVYTGPILITETTTLKVIAVNYGLSSEVLTAVYTIPQGYTNWVKRVPFTEDSTASITFNNLSANDIYLVKVNTSNLVINAADTGGVSGSYPSLFNGFQGGSMFNAPQDTWIMGHPTALEFYDNVRPGINETQPLMFSNFIPPEVGDTREFKIETSYGSGTYISKQATLRATGLYGNVWVLDENYTSGTSSGTQISTSTAEAIRDKFDLIYPAETNLIGYEFGGGPGGDGGRDGDPKIQLLFYYIGNGVAGFFHSKDYGSSFGDVSTISNMAEIMYIDTSVTNQFIDFIYSTLVHEFAHMITFNMKLGKGSLETWYAEMLAMMAEDLTAPLIGIELTNNSNHVIRARMPTFLLNYNQVGITEWTNLSSASYAKGTAFGAYLLRNYGGAELLKTILANNYTGLSSVTNAVRATGSPNITFEQLVSRFGEALIFSGPSISADVTSFDRTVTKTINGYTYTAAGFDIWNNFTQKGPVIFDLTQKEMTRRSLSVHSANEWKNKTGTFTVTLEKPNNSYIEFYLMAK